MSVDPAIMTAAEYASWESRADVLYHFYAYHYFDQGPRHADSIDLINLDDADVQFYNRIADQIHRFAGQPKLFKYLKDAAPFKLPSSGQDEFGNAITTRNEADIKFMTEQINSNNFSMRQRLIQHVRVYNLTQEPRRRLFLVGLNMDDCDFLVTLIPKPANDMGNGVRNDTLQASPYAVSDIGPADVNVATDGCLAPAVKPSGEKDPVAIMAEAFMAGICLRPPQAKNSMVKPETQHTDDNIQEQVGEVECNNSALERELRASVETFASDKKHRL